VLLVRQVCVAEEDVQPMVQVTRLADVDDRAADVPEGPNPPLLDQWKTVGPSDPGAR
jgi:hypothetical protein